MERRYCCFSIPFFFDHRLSFHQAAMSKISMNDRRHSMLELLEHDETIRAPELVNHDETTRAPERDWDATAFELDASVLASEVSKTLVRIRN